MDRMTHKKILAEMYGCAEGKLLDQYARMMPQIRSSAIGTLSIEKKVESRQTVNA